MSNEHQSNLTRLLDAASNGDESAQDRLWAIVYNELRAIAHRQMGKEGARQYLQTTVLVQEAYLRLTASGDVKWSNRRHFFSAAAQAMRRICVDDARNRGRLKRGGGQEPLSFETDPAFIDLDPTEVIAVDDALKKLERVAPRQAEVVNLRYFVGLTIDETAEVLGVSPRTVDIEWRYARAWLHRELYDGETNA